MSRCFPFPPPGYEKKTRIDDLDLLKKEKEKHREKKHKKEKRDKEKKEGKEKREKDRSDEKEKEKKEKKEKHRDKKKDKEKNRDKDKNNHVPSDEKILLGHAEADKGEKNYAKSKGTEKEKSTVSGDKVMGYSTVCNRVVVGKNNHLASENKNSKQLHDSGNKIAIEEGKRSNLLSEKFPTMEKKDVGMPRMGVSTPATPMATSERSKERKINDGKMDRHGPSAVGRPIENMLVQKFAGMAQNRVEGVARQVQKNAERRVEVKEKITGIEGDGKKGVKRKDEDRVKTMEKYKERDKKMKVEERQKNMCGERVVEQLRAKDNNMVQADLVRGKDGSKKDLLLAQRASPAKLVKEDNKAAAVAIPEILKKRKEFGPNGVLHEGDVGPNKLPRITFSTLPMTENGRRPSQTSTTIFSPVKQQALSIAKQDEDDVRPNKVAKITSSSLPVTENGRSLQPSQDSTVFAPVKQQILSSVKQDYKDCRKNGTINSLQSALQASQDSTVFAPVKQQALSSGKKDYKDRRKNGTINSLQSTPRASQATAPADQNSGAVKKLPHPDTKYLTQILSVPKAEEWSEFDEQEWLFSSSHSQQNKPKAETSRVDDTTHHVWAEPLRIESADVFALPYVIPR